MGGAGARGDGGGGRKMEEAREKGLSKDAAEQIKADPDGDLRMKRENAARQRLFPSPC